MAKVEKIAIPRIEFDFPFKGARNYIHSTTILTEFVARFAPSGPVKLEFRQMINHPIYIAADDPEQSNRVGKYSYMDADGWQSYGIFTDASRRVTERVACIEKDVIAASDISGDEALGEIGRPGNFIETAVSLNKAIVGRRAGEGKKVIFSTLAVSRIPQSGKIGIHLKKNLGTKIYMSDISCDGEKIGNLTFMTV
jgi:hypothetical protein